MKKEELPSIDGLHQYFVALGRRGGTAAAGAGARARYKKMTKAERVALAKRAARARWAKKRKKR